MKRLRIDPAACAAILWLCFVERSVWAVLILLAAALHELGHIAAARALHVGLGAMTVGALGASLAVADGLLSYRDEALIAAAGPAVNLICLGGAVFLHRQQPDDRLLFFAAASLALAAVNLLPLPAFDGGRILACICARRHDPAAVDRITACIGGAAAVCLWLTAAALALRTGGNLSLLALSSVVLWRAVFPYGMVNCPGRDAHR